MGPCAKPRWTENIFYKVAFHNIQFEFSGLPVASVSPLESHPGSLTKNKPLNCLGKTPMAGPYSGLWVSSYGDLPESLRTLPALPLPLVTQSVKEQQMQKACEGRAISPAKPDPLSPFPFPIKMEMCCGCLSQTLLPGRTGKGQGPLRSPTQAIAAGLEVGNLTQDDLESSVAGWRR